MRSIFLALAFCSQAAFAMPNTIPSSEKIYDSLKGEWLRPDEFALAIHPGEVLVMGELHATKDNVEDAGIQIQHSDQLAMINVMRSRGFATSVGMEFLEYPFQKSVDQFLKGAISEAEFLKAVQWGSNPFDFYRDQILAPLKSRGTTVALNIPRAIANKVSRDGIFSLDEEDRAFLPPIWERGSDPYFNRFEEAMKDHATPAQIENFFMAQSLWDDTMAWNVSKHQKSYDDNMVIIVGEFHVEYNLGLPARLARYGVQQVKTMVHAEVKDWTEEALSEAVKPDPKLGPRADYIWVFKR
jgi:uncharacterized iron-regulated protein